MASRLMRSPALRPLAVSRRLRALRTSTGGPHQAVCSQPGQEVSAAYGWGVGGMAVVALYLLHQHESDAPPSTCASAHVKHSLYVTGSNSKAHVKAVCRPAVAQEVVIPGEPGVVDSVAFGPDYTVVAKEGNLYVFGSLDAPPTVLPPVPKGWFSAISDVVVQVVSTEDAIYGRTNKGRVWQWRRVSGKEGDAPVFRSPRALLSNQGPVQFIAAGPQHAAFVTKKGEVFAMGDNSDGRCGVGLESVGARVESPTPVKGIPEGATIVKASCGNCHTLLLDSKGGAYSFGGDQWYQLGHGETWKVTKDRDEAIVMEAKKVRQFEEMTVTDIAAGGNHSLFAVEYPGYVVSKGRNDAKIRTPVYYREVWATGLGQFGQLGDRMYVHMSIPRKVKDLSLVTEPDRSLPTAQLACGDNHSAAIVPLQQAGGVGDGEIWKYSRFLYIWGNNLGNQVGTGKAGNVAKPTQPQAIPQDRVEAVVCGFDRTGIILRKEE